MTLVAAEVLPIQTEELRQRVSLGILGAFERLKVATGHRQAGMPQPRLDIADLRAGVLHPAAPGRLSQPMFTVRC